jgi:predicted  nucleic acid-binding Zn-ribbon protein
MSKRFFEKPMQQSPKKLSYYESPTSNEPKTLSFNIFKESHRQRPSTESESYHKLQKEITALRLDNLQLTKELSKYKNEYFKATRELKSSERTCDCDYCDYVTTSYEHIIHEYDKSIEKNKLSEQFIKELLQDIINTNKSLEKVIEDPLQLDNLVDSIKQSIQDSQNN